MKPVHELLRTLESFRADSLVESTFIWGQRQQVCRHQGVDQTTAGLQTSGEQTKLQQVSRHQGVDQTTAGL